MVLVVSKVFLETLASGKIGEDLDLVSDYFLLCQDEFFSILIAGPRPAGPSACQDRRDQGQAVENVLLRLNKPKFERSFKWSWPTSIVGVP